jgi:hypothetical protein
VIRLQTISAFPKNVWRRLLLPQVTVAATWTVLAWKRVEWQESAQKFLAAQTAEL